jgi:hypothetical protein|tara:strand:- start:134 stop:694 length:561 start_codon:yes stop_codon:yes gene_type:complete
MGVDWDLIIDSYELGTLRSSKNLYKLNLKEFGNHKFSQLTDLINDTSKVKITLEVSWNGDITTINKDNQKTFHENETYYKTIIINPHEEEHWNINWFKELYFHQDEFDGLSFLNETFSSIDFEEIYEGEKIIEDSPYGPEDILKFEVEIIGEIDVEKTKNWFLSYYNSCGFEDLDEVGNKFLGINS